MYDKSCNHYDSIIVGKDDQPSIETEHVCVLQPIAIGSFQEVTLYKACTHSDHKQCPFYLKYLNSPLDYDDIDDIENELFKESSIITDKKQENKSFNNINTTFNKSKKKSLPLPIIEKETPAKNDIIVKDEKDYKFLDL